MPHLDALGVIKDVKAAENAPTTLFMVMSSFDSTALEYELTASGVSYFFLKPIDVDLVVERILQIANAHDKASEKTPLLPYQSFQQATPSETLKITVTNIMHQIGVPAHIKGYHYLRDSIILVVQDPSMINAVTKVLYTTVADMYTATSSRVERAIRHAIEVAWDRGDIDTLNSYFGYTIFSGRGKPTNSEFIAMISDKIRLSQRTIA